MDSPHKYEATRKWVAEAGSPSSNANAEDQDNSAVIIIQTGPEDESTFSWRKFLVHMGYAQNI